MIEMHLFTIEEHFQENTKSVPDLFHEGAAGYPYDASRGKAAQRGTSGNRERLS
jgi:hypothetical protein